MKKTNKIVNAALLGAFTCVATLISIGPLPPSNGYVHPGDALVLLCGFIMGPLYGGFAAATGSAIADITLGYVVYAPATFIIKFLVACCAGLIYRIKDKSVAKLILASAISEIIMILGYYICEGFILGGGIGAVAALSAVPANILQGAFALVTAPIIVNTLKSKGILK